MKKSHKSVPIFSIQCYEDRQHTLRLRKPAEEATEHVDEQERQAPVKKQPPPPPPMPTNGHHNGDLNGDRTPKTEDIKKTPIIKKVVALNRTPTPDYNDKELTLPIKTNIINESNADVDSLESYKLQSPENLSPKPPSNYFFKAPNGTATMKKHSRPVSVTIGEYVNNMNRREPSKLEFLNGEKKNCKVLDEESLSSRLHSELALTLSRSNLRKKTETMVDGGR